MSRNNNDATLLNTSMDLLGRERKYKHALRLLLDWMGDRKDHHIAQRIKMGTSTSYFITVSLGWVAENVLFARDLPIFNEHLNDIVNSVNINYTNTKYLQHKDIDHSRQQPMSLYLATRKHHKFPPLLLVAYQDWVYDTKHDNWDSRGYATKASINVDYIDSNASIVDLDLTNTRYFAFDGQHRLLAIKGLKEILHNGRLPAKNRDGTVKLKNDITREDIEYYLEEQNIDSRKLQGVMDEIVGIEIIPAVQHRETFADSLSRLCNVFVDVNETAKRPPPGRRSIIDDNNGFRIVAREIMVRHQLFRGHNDEFNVDTNTAQLSEKSPKYASLESLVSMSENYLGSRVEFITWKDSVVGLNGGRGSGLLRPDSKELEKGIEKLSAYFDNLASLPSHKEMILYFSSDGSLGTPPNILRTDDEINILFLPIAQLALARAIARFETRMGANISDIFKKISRHEDLGDLRLVRKDAPWFGILCEPLELKIRRHKKYEDLCVEMFTYLLLGSVGDSRRKVRFRKDCFEARAIKTSDTSEKMAWDFSGLPKDEESFTLPKPW